MLLSDYNPKKFSIGGSWLSEKYDGMRAIWLPHTRGIPFNTVCFANTARDKRNPLCSGLWTRRGKNIAAPDWWLDKLPLVPLDGELFKGRGNFQKVASTVRKLEPIDEEWKGLIYEVFDSPSLSQVYKCGFISEGGKVSKPSYSAKIPWDAHLAHKSSPNYNPRRFNDALRFIEKHAFTDVSTVARQVQLPFSDQEAQRYIDEAFADVINGGGEGLVLRRGHTIWEPIRSLEVVKVKPLHKGEGTVIGYVLGQGKHVGRIGALRLRWPQTHLDISGKVFDLGGLTDDERKFSQIVDWGRIEDIKPGAVVTTATLSEEFKLGSKVKFVYNDLTEDGMPKFARYSRALEEDEDEVPTDDAVCGAGVPIP